MNIQELCDLLARYLDMITKPDWNIPDTYLIRSYCIDSDQYGLMHVTSQDFSLNKPVEFALVRPHCKIELTLSELLNSDIPNKIEKLLELNKIKSVVYGLPTISKLVEYVKIINDPSVSASDLYVKIGGLPNRFFPESVNVFESCITFINNRGTTITCSVEELEDSEILHQIETVLIDNYERIKKSATTPKISENSNEVINLLIDYLKFCNTPNPDGIWPSCYISIGTGMWVITAVNTSYDKESDEWWVCKFRKYLGKSEHAIVSHEIRMGMMDIKEYSILEKISKVMSK